MTQLYTNNATSTLAAGITNVATSLTVQTGDGAKFPALVAPDFFLATLYQLVSGAEANWEVVKVTARAADVFTIVRAQQATTARAFNISDPIQLRWTQDDAANSIASLGAGALIKTNPRTINEDITITPNLGAISIGPMTIGVGRTVTVGSNARWLIL